jgi:hypothetical protein
MTSINGNGDTGNVSWWFVIWHHIKVKTHCGIRRHKAMSIGLFNFSCATCDYIPKRSKKLNDAYK